MSGRARQPCWRYLPVLTMEFRTIIEINSREISILSDTVTIPTVTTTIRRLDEAAIKTMRTVAVAVAVIRETGIITLSIIFLLKESQPNFPSQLKMLSTFKIKQFLFLFIYKRLYSKHSNKILLLYMHTYIHTYSAASIFLIQ